MEVKPMYNLKLKTVVIALAAFFLLFELMPGQAAAAICKNNIPCVNSNDIIDGQVTTPDITDNAVSGAKVLDGSLTGADVQDGSITRADTQPVAKQVVVATSGGDYTSISAALAAISPSATNPYVIEVMPGTYTENVTMKNYVQLRGAGREVTTLQAASTLSPVITLNVLTHVGISDLTITGGSYGILNNSSSSLTISGNTITGNWAGIYNDSSSPTISGNTITGNGSHGINNYSSSSPTIIGNTITGNSAYGIANGSSSSPSIIYNRITDNGGVSYTDIYVDGTSMPNISFNIYDDITGTNGVGMYNVNSSGDAAPAP